MIDPGLRKSMNVRKAPHCCNCMFSTCTISQADGYKQLCKKTGDKVSVDTTCDMHEMMNK